MKFKDIFTKVENKSNKQINLNLKKRKLKDLDIDINAILEMRFDKKECRFK